MARTNEHDLDRMIPKMKVSTKARLNEHDLNDLQQRLRIKPSSMARINEPDFDSSDLEFSSEEDAPPRKQRRAIQNIIEQSVQHRIESKKILQQLKDTGGAPTTNSQRQYWYDLFREFATTILDIDDRPNKTPTGNDVLRFMARVPSYVKSRRSSGQMAWGYLKTVKAQLSRSLTFHYKDFSLSNYDSLQINALMQKLLDEGKLTKDPVREKQWITCQMIEKMARALFSNAIENGTQSWDYTISGTFSLVLQAALASRCGDFKRAGSYSGDEYVKWKDVQMKATIENGKVKFHMLISLNYLKACKGDGSLVQQVQLDQLTENNDNVVDCVKLCLIYALRIGAVKETNWQELVTTVLGRFNKRVVWTRPDSPVFYAYTKSQHLDFSKPAPATQQTTFLRHAAQLIGMLNMPVSHDIRRGAASDLYNVTTTVITGNIDSVRKALGHTNKTAQLGVTERYIGREKGDAWAQRLEQRAPPKEDVFAIETAPKPFKQRRLLPIDITEYCEANQLDSKQPADRRRASKALSKDHFDRWSVLQRDVVMTPPPNEHSSELPPALSTTEALIVTVEPSPCQEDKQQVMHDSPPADLATTGRPLALFAHELGMTDKTNDLTDSDPTTLMEECATLLDTSEKLEPCAILKASADEFIGHFSKINLFSIGSKKLPVNLESGNSRDPPSRFWFRCSTTGCPKTFITAKECNRHKLKCSPDWRGLGASANDIPRPTKRLRKPTDDDEVDDDFPS